MQNVMWRSIEYSRDRNSLFSNAGDIGITKHVKHLNRTKIGDSIKNERYLISFCTNINKIRVLSLIKQQGY